MDPERYLVKISLGKKLSTEEIAEVASVLEEITPGNLGVLQFSEDVYSAIVVLGKANAREHRQLIAKHLDGNDPQTVSLILETLCLNWGHIEDYIEWVFRFAVGISWDLEEDVRRSAIKVLGEYLRTRFQQSAPQEQNGHVNGTAKRRSTEQCASKAASKADDRFGAAEPPSSELWRVRNRELLDLLFSILADDDADPFTRLAAYAALLRVGGKSWEELPSEFVPLDFGQDSEDVDRATLDAVRGLSQ